MYLKYALAKMDIQSDLLYERDKIMKKESNGRKRILSAMLTTLFMAQQTMLLSVGATEITGVNGTNGVYNINPTSIMKNSDGSFTDVGYRKYKDFVLSKDDVANLIFKYGKNNIETFVNMVDNRIQVDGLVNSMRDNNFYNGKAIFVSPNGMVVGASGILNVGSLGVYTPTKSVYDDYLSNPRADLGTLVTSNGGATVNIAGKVMAAQDIDIRAGKVEVPGKMIAGTGNNAVANGRARAEEIFNSIVNTEDMKTYSTGKHGNITINSSVGTDISGFAKDYGIGNVTINNTINTP